MDIQTQEFNPNYDYRKAKINSSVKWILSRCKTDSFGIQLNDENVEDDEISILDKYPIIEDNLCNGSLYKESMLCMFQDAKKYITSNDFTPMIQWLLRKGIEMSESVKNDHLSEKPINKDVHLSFINALMKASNLRCFAIEKVVKAVKRFTTFSPSSELPLNLESTIYFWVNKAVIFFIRSMKANDPIRYESLRDDLSVESCEDFSDGRALCFLLAFYYPTTFPIHNIEFGEDLAIADCLYNLSIFFNFCSEKIFPKKLLNLTINDIFHSHHEMSVNIFSFLADLFLNFDSITVISTFPMPFQIPEAATVETNHERPNIKKHCPSTILLPKRQKTFNSSSYIYEIKNDIKAKPRIKSANYESREFLHSTAVQARKETIHQAWEKEKAIPKSKKYFPEININEEMKINEKNEYENGIKKFNDIDEKIDPKKSYTIPNKRGNLDISASVRSPKNIDGSNSSENIEILKENLSNDNFRNESSLSNVGEIGIKNTVYLSEHSKESKEKLAKMELGLQYISEGSGDNISLVPNSKLYQSEIFSKPTIKAGSLSNHDVMALNLSRNVNRGTFRIPKAEKEEKMKKSLLLNQELLVKDGEGKVDVPEKVLNEIGLVYHAEQIDDGKLNERQHLDNAHKINIEENIDGQSENSTPTEEYELASSDATMWVTAITDAPYEQDSLNHAQTSFINIANSRKSDENFSLNNHINYSPVNQRKYGKNNPVKSTTFTSTTPFNKTSWVDIAEDQKSKKTNNELPGNQRHAGNKMSADKLVVKMDMEAKRKRIKEEWNKLQQSKKEQHENIGKKAFINTFLSKKEVQLDSKDSGYIGAKDSKILEETIIGGEETSAVRTAASLSDTLNNSRPQPKMANENNFSSRFVQPPHISELDEGFEKLRNEIKRLSLEQDKLKNYVEQISNNKSEQDVGGSRISTPLVVRRDSNLIAQGSENNFAQSCHIPASIVYNQPYKQIPNLNQNFISFESNSSQNAHYSIVPTMAGTYIDQRGPQFDEWHNQMYYVSKPMDTMVHMSSPVNMFPFTVSNMTTNEGLGVIAPQMNMEIPTSSLQFSGSLIFPAASSNSNAVSKSQSNLEYTHSTSKPLFKDENYNIRNSTYSEYEDRSSPDPALQLMPTMTTAQINVKSVSSVCSEINEKMSHLTISDNLYLHHQPPATNAQLAGSSGKGNQEKFFVPIEPDVVTMNDGASNIGNKDNYVFVEENHCIPTNEEMENIGVAEDGNVGELNVNIVVAPTAFVVGQSSSEDIKLEKDQRRLMITQQLEQRRREERERKRQLVDDERDKKKEKSTDCDSALIPLLCVHG